MTDLPPETPPATPPPDETVPPAGPSMPAWVPVLIGAVLVAIAALAVFTGLRYRSDSFVKVVRPRRVPHATPAPPGEPEAGASLMFPGESGDNTPAAHPPVTGRSRAIVTGTGSSVEGVVRMWARRGLATEVVPADAVVYVNDVPIGEARQFTGPENVYDFPAAGSYNVKVVAPGFRERSFVVTASEDAKAEIAKIKATLDRE